VDARILVRTYVFALHSIFRLGECEWWVGAMPRLRPVRQNASIRALA
jgi:hypothetical protein